MSDDESYSDDETVVSEDEEPEDIDEVDLKSVSSFNKVIIIVRPENRQTSNILSLFEMTEIVSIRATQISKHNNCMVDITGLDDPIKMAQRELMARKCPLMLRRPVGELYDKDKKEMRSYCEDWDVNVMQFSTTYHGVL